MKKIMLAIADGLGSCPIQMALEDGDESLLKRAEDLEASKLEFLFIAKWVSDQWQAWAVSVSRHGEIGMTRSAIARSAWQDGDEKKRDRRDQTIL
ncbi:hypothetical protein CMV_028963 [Castanea mollissima]|uniref:Uncharacterized protein n=1 Tax=Castanea mollissima TaxID=60419 RepID=A0A8J4Q6M4_9ROSI|nr:hypothetical protein CMV_028963 [Castanea mollissima]